MYKAFIFDLDGVLIDNEVLWERIKETIYSEVFEEEVVSQLGSTIGLNIDLIFKKAKQHGSAVSKKSLIDAFYRYAPNIYQTAPITSGLDQLVQTLVKYRYAIGITTSSPKDWMNIVIQRLPFRNQISSTLSLHDRTDLNPKPAPDGYNEMIAKLEAQPISTIILEDSNAGIAAAKASGAYTIGLKENLVKDYIQKGADIYANDINSVTEIVKKFSARSTSQ